MLKRENDMKNSWVSTSFPHSTSHSLLSVKFCQVKEENRTLESNQIPEEKYTGPLSAVGNVSGYRCESDCRSRGCEFDPCSVHTFLEIDHEINSTVILRHIPPGTRFRALSAGVQCTLRVAG